MLKIINIAEGGITAEIFGGKAFGLSMLHKQGYKIPRTIIIQATNCVEDIDTPDFQDALLENLLPFEINEKYDLAVRSSCTNEDAFGNSMAGHFDTFIGNMSFDEVCLNLKKVISGLKKVTVANCKMGVVIQEKIDAEFAGVLFTSDPISYSKKQMVISYTKGIGDKLVSGEVSGTDIIVTMKGNDYAIVGEENTLINDTLLMLARDGKNLESKLKYPLDIEWAIVGTNIIYLQCRPLANITSIHSSFFLVNKQNISSAPAQLVSHDKVQLRLSAQETNTFISDAYVYIKNTCDSNDILFEIPTSEFCKGHSAVIIYPQRLSNKVIRSFVGDKKKVLNSLADCHRYGIRSFPQYENLNSCLNNYCSLLYDEYWVSTTILQEIFDPLYTGVIQKIPEGFVIEITRGHFLTKGVVPTSQYIVNVDGIVLERTEVNQHTWLKIIEGHVVECTNDKGKQKQSLVSLNEEEIQTIVKCFAPIIKTDTNVVEFGVLKHKDFIKPYLIDFVDENSPINISSMDIKSGIISCGCVTGKSVYIKSGENNSLDAHFHNVLEEDKTLRSNEHIVFFCKNPELALLYFLEKYNPKNIGVVFENCAMGAHLAVVLREKGIPAIKVSSSSWKMVQNEICTIDSKTPNISPKERLKYE